MTTMTAAPLVEPCVAAFLELDSTGRNWLAVVQCPHPWCLDTHTHGAGPIGEPPLLGNRLSHCLWGETAGYDLVLAPPSMPRPVPLTASERARRMTRGGRP